MSGVIALVSARAARDQDEDMPPLQAALTAIGLRNQIVDWDDREVDWTSFDAAVLRSTWDYSSRINEFLDWVTRVSAATVLLNSAATVRWNTDKHYLGELARAGVPVVPSTFLEPGHDAREPIETFFARHPGELVVKPCISAGSRDTQRHTRKELHAAIEQAQGLLNRRRSVLLQPYLARVDQEGETALIYFSGQFSHAIRKGPLLPAGGQATQALFAPEEIVPRQPAPEEAGVAEKALAALPVTAPLYARIDLIRDEERKPVVLEVELTEPSVFLSHSPGADARFAEALRKALREAGR